jgi:hypothetical protein
LRHRKPGRRCGQGLAFVPLHTERFDLAMRRRTYFEPGPQALPTLMRTEDFRRHADLLGGLDVGDAGSVRLNRRRAGSMSVGMAAAVEDNWCKPKNVAVAAQVRLPDDVHLLQCQPGIASPGGSPLSGWHSREEPADGASFASSVKMGPSMAGIQQRTLRCSRRGDRLDARRPSEFQQRRRNLAGHDQKST